MKTLKESLLTQSEEKVQDLKNELNEAQYYFGHLYTVLDLPAISHAGMTDNVWWSHKLGERFSLSRLMKLTQGQSFRNPNHADLDCSSVAGYLLMYLDNLDVRTLDGGEALVDDHSKIYGMGPALLKKMRSDRVLKHPKDMTIKFRNGRGKNGVKLVFNDPIVFPELTMVIKRNDGTY